MFAQRQSVGITQKLTKISAGLVIVGSTLTLGTIAASAAQNQTNSANNASSQAASNSKLALPKIGDHGQSVTSLQTILIKSGVVLKGGADGVFGVGTRAAISRFQRANNLQVTGTLDKATAIKLGLMPAPTTVVVGTSFTVKSLPTKGMMSARVALVQKALLAAGVRVKGGADGEFGAATADAITRFQKTNGLKATGKLNKATAIKLGLIQAPAAPVIVAPPVAGQLDVNNLPTLGSTGDHVTLLQNTLIAAGIYVKGGADGKFGVGTETAVKAIQGVRTLPVTGIVDKATAQALNLLPQDPATPKLDLLSLPKRGDKGDAVRLLQSTLVKNGIQLNGGIDGDFGGATASAISKYQTAKGLPVTWQLDIATARSLDLVPPPDPNAMLKVFPVQGVCGFEDTWNAPRGNSRVHLGVDIIAPHDNLLYAVNDGVISKMTLENSGPLSGNALRLQMPDGTYFFYAHMNKFAPGITVGTAVKAGQIIGYVGDTGATTTNHLHFEIHPGGGAAVNPYPFVKAIDACQSTAVPTQPVV